MTITGTGLEDEFATNYQFEAQVCFVFIDMCPSLVGILSHLLTSIEQGAGLPESKYYD